MHAHVLPIDVVLGEASLHMEALLGLRGVQLLRALHFFHFIISEVNQLGEAVAKFLFGGLLGRRTLVFQCSFHFYGVSSEGFELGRRG